MNSEPGIDLEKRDGIAIVTIRNPQRRNAFTPAMRRALTDTLAQLMTEGEIRAIVLRGDGEHFCSGADLSTSRAAGWTLIQHRENSREITRLTELLARGPKPVIAAVEGAAAAAGMGIACACDVVVAGGAANFIPLFTRLGLVPEVGLMYTLGQRIGAARARRMLMSSKPLDAVAALKIGLVDEVVEPGHAFGRAIEIAHEFDDCVPLAVAVVKEAFANGVPDVAAASRIEVDFVPLLVRTEDTREGIAAAREKRRPKFTGN